MLNADFVRFINETFRTVSYQGNPSSKKLKCNGAVFSVKEAFTVVQEAYKDAVTSGKEKQTDATLIKVGSEEAGEVVNILLQIAKENKKAHAKHESVRREAEVGGSLGDTLSKLNENPTKPNKVDIEILGNFCIAETDNMREVFYKDEQGNLTSIGMYTDGSRSVQSIAEFMARLHPLDVANSYATGESSISNAYNTMQTMTESEIEDLLVLMNMNDWTEIKSLYRKDLESVLLAIIAHYRTNTLPALMWALGYINLYRVTSSKQEGENKISWTSGFKFKMQTGMLNDDVTYYANALKFPQYFQTIPSPRRFGDIYKLPEHPEIVGHVLKSYLENPFLKAIFTEMTPHQIMVYCAFWYCVAHHLLTPSLLMLDNGGNVKNGNVEVYKEGISIMWKCPKKDVYFKLERDQLANKDRKYHVKSDGLCKRTLLDSLFVFYDEIAPSRDMWEEFKSLSGSNQVSINVRPLYGDPYTVSSAPVPFFMTKNSYTPLYEKGPMMRRLVVIRTNANNSYLNVLTEDERNSMDDPQVRADTFATLMALGKKAYEKIESMGGMLNINNIFPDIGAVLGSAAEDHEIEMKYFYKTLFDDKDPTTEKIVITVEDLQTRFLKLYPDLDTDKMSNDSKKALEMRISNFLLGIDVRNDKKRLSVYKAHKRSQPWGYILYRNEVISNMTNPFLEVEDITK